MRLVFTSLSIVGWDVCVCVRVMGGLVYDLKKITGVLVKIQTPEFGG